MTPVDDTSFDDTSFDDTSFKVEPDPPVSGQPCEITYSGKYEEIDVFIDDKHWKTLRPDKDGKIRLPSVPAGREMSLSDGHGHPGYRVVDIQELGARA